MLCNFEESVLKGRIRPIHSVEGFQLQIGKKITILFVIKYLKFFKVITGDSYSSQHFTAPVTIFYFNEDAPSLYMVYKFIITVCIIYKILHFL